jgi:hypothetical protein
MARQKALLQINEEIRVAIFEDNKLLRDALQTILNGTRAIHVAVHSQTVIVGNEILKAVNRTSY